jgi:hypothetical protein
MNISKATMSRVDMGVVLIYVMGRPEPQFAISIAPISTLVIRNNGSIIVKVREKLQKNI